MPPSIQIVMERPIVLLKSVEIDQNKLATDQKVRARTDKLSALGQVGRSFFLVIKTKRQTRTIIPNKIVIPFVAYNATTGINKPTKLNAREIPDILVWICFKFDNNFYLSVKLIDINLIGRINRCLLLNWQLTVLFYILILPEISITTEIYPATFGSLFSQLDIAQIGNHKKI